jgi:hypothetical protein
MLGDTNMDKLQSMEEFQDTLKSLGLSLDDQTGGTFNSGLKKVEITASHYQRYRTDHDGEGKIMFLDPAFFLKTVKMTEDSLKVKLFV